MYIKYYIVFRLTPEHFFFKLREYLQYQRTKYSKCVELVQELTQTFFNVQKIPLAQFNYKRSRVCFLTTERFKQ